MRNLASQKLKDVAGPSRQIAKPKHRKKSSVSGDSLKDSLESLAEGIKRFAEVRSRHTTESVNQPSDNDRVQDKLDELGLEMYPSYYWQAIEYFVNNPEYAKRWLRSPDVIKRQVLIEKIGPWPGYV